MTTGICKVVKAGQQAAKLLSYIAKKAVCFRADLGFGVMRLRRKQLTWAVDALRGFHDGSHASEVRHIIFSVPKDVPRRHAQRLLFSMFSDWRKTYAPGREWAAAIHHPNHLHVALANYGKDGEPINFRPHQVKAMADMQFTQAVISAKGTGKRKSLAVYPKAKKLAVRDLATLLLDDHGRVKDDAWERLKKEGILSSFRLRKDGSPISFEYAGKRIRIATLRHFILEKQQATKNKTMPLDIIKSDQPLPDSLAQKLMKTGFSKADLDTLNRNLRDAHALHPRPAAKAKTIEPQPPKR